MRKNSVINVCKCHGTNPNNDMHKLNGSKT